MKSSEPDHMACLLVHSSQQFLAVHNVYVAVSVLYIVEDDMDMQAVIFMIMHAVVSMPAGKV